MPKTAKKIFMVILLNSDLILASITDWPSGSSQAFFDHIIEYSPLFVKCLVYAASVKQ